MKITLGLVLCGFGMFHSIGVAHAQTQVLPNGVGGFNTYGSDGSLQILSNGAGGFNIYGR